MRHPKRPIGERFWSKVDKSGGEGACWPWRGTRKEHGHGQFTDQTNSVKMKWQAHRLAYTLAVGPIPDGLLVRHRCDNPPCCNPAHLETGTHRDNTADAIRRGRLNPARREGSRRMPTEIPPGKTHCRHGHERTITNVYIAKGGKLICRECAKRRAMDRYNRQHQYQAKAS